jgi:5'-nucleotidase
MVPEKVDLIVSGINTGANLGYDVTYSGTVTAVMEGIIMGVPGVAVSMDGGGLHRSELDYSAAVDVATWVVKKVMAEGLPENTFLNVNVPQVNGNKLNGI